MSKLVAENLNELNNKFNDNFRRWFDGSKVVDENDQPLIVYHGTGQDFDTFSYGYNGVNKKPEFAFYFTDRPDIAGNYATLPIGMAKFSDEYKRENHNPSIMPVYIKITNPKIIDANGGKWKELNIRSKILNAKKRGHDGVIIKNLHDVIENETQYVVFYSTQIKSAIGNTGAYIDGRSNITESMATPRIRKIKSFKTDEGKFSYYDFEDEPRDRMTMFTVFEDRNGWIVRNAFVPDTMQNQGIATQFYIDMNDMSRQKTGKPLRSTQPRMISGGEIVHELSVFGIKLWDSLVRKGYAEKLGDKNYKFII